MPRTPGILAVLEAFQADDRARLHVALPGRVESYDPATQTADIKPMVLAVTRDQDDTRGTDPHPVIPAVPVAFSRGGGYFVTFPLVAGDSGLLVFCEADLGPWRATGVDSDPLDDGRHTLAGAVFYPGLETVARALATRPDHLVLGKEGGLEIHLDDTFVQLGAVGGQLVALSNLVDARFAAIHDALAGVTPAPPSGPDAGEPGLIAFQTALATAFASTAATKVKAT